ncbi:MAG: hypothetical protein ABW217_04475 [Polyangiaceae bacterium]
MRSAGLIAVLALSLAGCEERAPAGTQAFSQALSTRDAPSKPAAPRVTLDVGNAYPNPQVIGDKKGVSIMKAPPGVAHSEPDAWAIEYIRNKKGITQAGLGGVCWQNRPGNQGDLAAGDDLSSKGYRRVSFWARGGKGGEVVEFRAGGLGNVKTRYQDSFDVSLGKVKLKSEWAEYSLFLNDADLSSVITPFCVIIEIGPNPDGALVYVDDIVYLG